jgi:hypothetical protein
MLWKIRCIIAWTFRVLSWISFIGSIGIIGHFASQEAEWFDKAFPTPIYGTVLAFAIVGLMGVLELFGRVFSWTNLNIWEYRLPRFRDRR